jgi:hypothetical protein
MKIGPPFPIFILGNCFKLIGVYLFIFSHINASHLDLSFVQFIKKIICINI